MNLFDKKEWSKFLKKYHVAIYSSDSQDSLKNFHVSKPVLIFSIIFIIIFYSAFEILIIKYTPLNKFFGHSESDSKRIGFLEEKVKTISIDMFKLREYTNHLKYALGDTSVMKSDKNPADQINHDYLDLKSAYLSSAPASSFDSDYLLSTANDRAIDVPFLTPLSNYVISQEFDEEKSHFGVDLAGRTGDPILAAADGFVVFSDWTNDFGNTIYIMHSSKFITVYKHNSSNIKNVGSYVRRGEVIALVGSTGKLSTSPHLHFEIWKNGLAKDPLKYLLIKK